MSEKHVKDALESIARRGVPENTNLWPALAAHLERKSPMTTLRSRPMLAVLIALFVLLALSGVAYAVGTMLGYVPGFGVVDENASLRVLSRPVSQTRDGITWTVKEAILGPNKTVVVYSLEGIQQDMLPHDEEISGCMDMPEIYLPNGDILRVTGGEGGYRETRWEYGPIPAGVNDVVFSMLCVADTLPGKAPTNWELPLHFIPTSEEKNIMPILEVSPFPTTIETETISAVSLYGISMKLDKFIPLPDGYYLIGHTEWTDDRILDVFPSGWGMKAFDDSGRELPLEPALSGEDRVVYEALERNQWVYRLYGRNFNGKVTLRIESMSVVFRDPIRLILNSPSNEFNFSDTQLGQSWDMNAMPFDIPGISANIVHMEYTQIGEGRGFDLTIYSDPSLDNIYFGFESGLDTSGLSRISGSSGGSSRDETTGTLHVIVTTNAKMIFPLVLRADGAGINGSWDASWVPAETDSYATPTYLPNACVTLEKWKNTVKNPIALPENIAEQLTMSDDYLPQGVKSSSPNGQWVAFSEKVLGRMTSGIFISSANTAEKKLLVQLDYWMVSIGSWSRDGQWLSFAVWNTDQSSPIANYGVVNINTCEFYRLP